MRAREETVRVCDVTGPFVRPYLRRPCLSPPNLVPMQTPIHTSTPVTKVGTPCPVEPDNRCTGQVWTQKWSRSDISAKFVRRMPPLSQLRLPPTPPPQYPFQQVVADLFHLHGLC
ncbi:hypothetical protein Pcinc_010687 [Petrolisthes cinctipes]|uniref:Uncharacterized protein n=1 Tax=Petrolisthes cinctipes TaxID=88211 RepID=A0AAE1G4X0_PETCI|nr:hypothetical protein Pcinc_010687 [Petrolisthes cinctipes]